ncbi:hypothetical protein, partial [Aquabacterium sp.]|uniref:hypothetical protein n=1 Tax=Aquabacterium sp. TaxID=1872578 RepID=UPI004038249D
MRSINHEAMHRQVIVPMRPLRITQFLNLHRMPQKLLGESHLRADLAMAVRARQMPKAPVFTGQFDWWKPIEGPSIKMQQGTREGERKRERVMSCEPEPEQDGDTVAQSIRMLIAVVEGGTYEAVAGCF